MRFRVWPTAVGVVLTAVLLTAPLVFLEWFRAGVQSAAGTSVPPAWALLSIAAGLRRRRRTPGRLARPSPLPADAPRPGRPRRRRPEKPFPPTVPGDGTVKASDDLPLVLSRLDGLVACYRHALDEVVRAQELLEKTRNDDASRGAADDSLGPTRYLGGGARRRMIARLAPNLHWIAATTPLQHFIGKPIGDLVARSFLDVVHPGDAAALQATLQEALRDGEGHDITFRVLTPGKPGRKRSLRGDSGLSLVESHLLMDVMTCYSEAGAPLNLRCHLLDVTDRVLTERELRRRTEEVSQANDRLREINRDIQRLKESYRDLYHHAAGPVFQPRRPRPARRLQRNHGADAGLSREELIGRQYTHLLTPAGATPFAPTAGCSSGTARWNPSGSSATAPSSTSGSERPSSRTTRASSSDRAAPPSTRRNASERRLRQGGSWKRPTQVRRINQELEDFTYVVSHDLKEPLRTLEAFSTFLAQDYGPALGDEGREYIDHLIQASRRLGALIDDLLTLSRAGRVIHAPRAFSWDEAVDIVRSDLQNLIQRKQAVVRVEGPLPPVAGDRERVMQLLANLITNALRYNKSEQPEVVLGARPDGEPDADPAFVTLFVRDNGIGIEAQYHEQIFRMFRRLHRARGDRRHRRRLGHL